jgi:hypothetical protein
MLFCKYILFAPVRFRGKEDIYRILRHGNQMPYQLYIQTQYTKFHVWIPETA